MAQNKSQVQHYIKCAQEDLVKAAYAYGMAVLNQMIHNGQEWVHANKETADEHAVWSSDRMQHLGKDLARYAALTGLPDA